MKPDNVDHIPAWDGHPAILKSDYVFDAQRIYDAGLADGAIRQAEHIIKLLEIADPARTVKARQTIRTNMMKIEKHIRNSTLLIWL